MNVKQKSIRVRYVRENFGDQQLPLFNHIKPEGLKRNRFHVKGRENLQKATE